MYEHNSYYSKLLVIIPLTFLYLIVFTIKWSVQRPFFCRQYRVRKRNAIVPMLRFQCLLIFLLACFSISGQTREPQQDLTNWSICGLNDRIDPSSWPQYELTHYGSPTNATEAFDNAFAEINPPAIIHAPAGTYTITSSVYVPSNIVIRGDGPGITIFELETADGAEFRDGFRFQGIMDKVQGECSPITADDTKTIPVNNPYSKWSTIIEVADGSYFSIGDNIEIEQENMATEITDDVSWADWCKGQIAVITNIEGNLIYLDRPLTADYLGTVRARKFKAAENIGLESFTIETVKESYNSNIGLEFAANCWITNVESKMCDRDHIRIDRSRNIEITGCFINDAHSHGAGGFGYGIRLSDHTGDCKIEDNVIRHLRHGLIVKEGANRNVFAHNYVREGFYTGGNHFPADISLHGHWAWLNLFEGNIVGRITVSDAWGRTGPGNILFRNRSERSMPISIEEDSDDQYVIGNEIIEPYVRKSDGTYFCGDNCNTISPGYCTGTWCGGVAPYYGECIQRDCYGGPNPIITEIDEEPEIDNTTRYGNQNYFGFVDDPITDLPNSYYLCTKPEYFTDSDSWPSIGPEFTLGSGTIPARKRWANYEASGDLQDLFPTPFCQRSMTIGQLPSSLSICATPVPALSSGLGGSGYSFEWFQDGQAILAATGPDYTPSEIGVYGIRVNTGSCVQSICSEVTDDISVNLGPDQILCNPASTILTPLVNGSGFKFAWNTGESTESIEVNTKGTYSVFVSSSNCSSVSDEIVVTSKTVTPIDESLACGGGEITLTTQENTNSSWYTALNGGQLAHQGASFTLSTTVDTTFYIQTSNDQHTFEIGPKLSELSSISPSHRNPNDYEDGLPKYRVEFSTATTVILDEVNVYVKPTQLNTFTFQLQVEDANGNTVGAAAPFVWTPTNLSEQLITVPVNITIPKGNDYYLHAVGSTSSKISWYYFREGGNYPYQDVVDGLAQITKGYDTYCTNDDNPVTYFFNWKFSLPNQLCQRVPINIKVDTCQNTDCNNEVNGSASIDNCGECSGGSTGLIPNASCTDCNNEVNGTATIDNCGVCSGGSTGLIPNASCTDCNNEVGGSATIDDCGVCSGGSTGLIPNASCTDCNNEVGGSASIDNCNVCSGGSTGLTPNASCTDCNNEVGGSASIDNCNVCSGGSTGIVPNASCTDCNYEVNGSATIDDCGVCSGGSTGLIPNASCTDCNNEVGGSASIDNCGVCSGGSTGLIPDASCTDCNNEVNGSASIDNCGVCSGGSTGLIPNASCTDCNNEVNGSATIDNCGVCSSGSTGLIPDASCTDCNNEVNGSATIDDCGVCSGGSTGLIPNTTYCTDCNNEVKGSASIDNCGLCSGGSTGLIPNASCSDCNNEVNGSASIDNCGVCSGGSTGLIPNASCTDCNNEVNGSASIDNCGICSGGSTGLIPNASCTDCNNEVNGSASIDNCGVCSGGSTGLIPNASCTDCNNEVNGSATIDNCGVCSSGSTGLIPDASCTDCNNEVNGTASIDHCGVCSGGSTGLITNASCTDCNNEVNGTATIDNCGVCVQGSTGVEACQQDCAGEWGGELVINDCGDCVAPHLVDENCMDIPSAFTPNGDGVNDSWNAEALRKYPNGTIQIYNRWGALVFTTSTSTPIWNGELNKKPLPTGTYYYVIITNTNNETLNGSITIVR